MTRLVAAPACVPPLRRHPCARAAVALATLLLAVPMAGMANDRDDSGSAPPGVAPVQVAPVHGRPQWAFEMQSDGTPGPVGALLALLGLGALNLTRRQTSHGVRV
jgi:MYXO-CTERM domain-containing protein